MSKFCGNCGTQLPDDAVVCSNCGVNSELEFGTTPKAKRKKSKRFKKILIAIIIVAVGVVGCFGYCIADYFVDFYDVDELVSKYVDAYYLCEADYDDIQDMLPPTHSDYFEGWFDDSDFNRLNELRSSNMDEIFGDDIVITYEIENLTKLRGDDKDFYITSSTYLLEMEYDEGIDEMYRFVLEVEIEGEEDEETEYRTFLAVKYEDEWCLFTHDNYFMYITPAAYEFTQS